MPFGEFIDYVRLVYVVPIGTPATYNPDVSYCDRKAECVKALVGTILNLLVI